MVDLARQHGTRSLSSACSISNLAFTGYIPIALYRVDGEITAASQATAAPPIGPLMGCSIARCRLRRHHGRDLPTFAETAIHCAMTVPIDYRQASADFDRFMLDLREELCLQTTHQAWGVLLGVFDTFRRRLETDHALAFARALPPLLRAAFVQDWHIRQQQPRFADRSTLDREVMAYHRDHQLAEPGCIVATAKVLWRHVDVHKVSAALAPMPAAAQDYWSAEKGCR